VTLLDRELSGEASEGFHGGRLRSSAGRIISSAAASSCASPPGAAIAAAKTWWSIKK
jgi:hypothetical protein